MLAHQLHYPPCALAADHQLITSVAAIYEHNDNIFLDDDDEVSDNITTVAPKLEWVRNGERLTARADGRAEFYHYDENEEFDDTDQRYNASFDYRPTERWQVSAQGSYSDDNRPDRDIETTGLVLGNIRRKRSNAGASASYMLTEITSIGLYTDFSREDFDDPETSDRKDYTVVLFMSRSLDAWLARTTGRLNLRYSHYAFDREYTLASTQGPFDVTTTTGDELDVDSAALTAGTETALTEKLNLTWDVGARYSRSERVVEQTRTYVPPLISEPALTVDDTYDSYGFVGSVSLGYQGERSHFDLLLSHDLAPISGSSGTANRTTARASAGLRILERLRVHCFLQWYLNVSDEDDATQDDIDEQTWNAGGGLHWELNDNFDLATDYVYTYRENREDNTTAQRSKVLVQLVASHDWLK